MKTSPLPTRAALGNATATSLVHVEIVIYLVYLQFNYTSLVNSLQSLSGTHGDRSYGPKPSHKHARIKDATEAGGCILRSDGKRRGLGHFWPSTFA